MFNFLGVAFADGDELDECVALFGGQGDFVKFFHRDFLVEGEGWSRVRDEWKEGYGFQKNKSRENP